MIKVIMRSVFYPWFILFIGFALGFIINAEWCGIKMMIMERSFNNIFNPVAKYNKNIENYIKKLGALRFVADHGFPANFKILEEEVIDEEFYVAKFKFTDKDGKIVEIKDSVRIRWRPWEYYYQDIDREAAAKDTIAN